MSTISRSGAHPSSANNETLTKSAIVSVENGITRYDGTIGGENLFAFLVPDDWNGELVLYAHGFIDSAEPLALPTKDNVVNIRDKIVSMGFAWAYCSYRENGMAVKDGAWATRQLQGLFVANVKTAPTYTWLVAHSLGGLIGGTAAQVDYVSDVRVLFDLFYPTVLPGTVIDVPYGLDINVDVIYPVVGAVQADPTGFGIISRLSQTPLPGRDGAELVQSLATAIGFNIRRIHDILERTHGLCPTDNFPTVYITPLPNMLPDMLPDMLPPEVLGMINASVQRYSRRRPTEELFDRYYEPNGVLTIPMITLHDRHDPVVPLFHEGLYRDKVAAAGNSQYLEQRTCERYGHTAFSADEAANALLDLREKAFAGMAMIP